LSEDNKEEYPFLTQKGYEIIKKHTTPRTYIGMGRYASYKEYGEEIWRIGYGSKKLGRRWVGAFEKADQKQVDEQLFEDLKEFSSLVAQYVFVPLNDNRKAAILSFAHSIGIGSFKSCRLLELINNLGSKQQIIKEWSPYINTLWRSGGEQLINRRRVEVDTYFAPEAEIPSLYYHECSSRYCLLNIPETYNGSPGQIKAIEYLERKFNSWDPSGEALRRFWRYWTEKPVGLSSLPPQTNNS
jgi:GH24 family phage-related lysozyme (muramidase)